MTRSKSSITKRWVVNTLCVIVVVLIGVTLVSLLLFREQYYGAVRATLDARATGLVRSYFSFSSGTPTEETFNMRANEYVENFNDKTLMEVWVIGSDGSVVVSSSGFSVAGEPFPDYEEALVSENGKAFWTGHTSSGEHVMALSFMLVPQNGEGGAVRYIISLADIDAQLRTLAVVLFALCGVILILVSVSGLYFVRSIVQPVKRITETAQRIADGDLSARIADSEYEDELGRLSSTINDMARELNETDRLKNEFISTVSHELRTPLTAIKGWGETLLDSPNEDASLTQKGLKVIISESERLSQLVEELLDFSRMESGNLSMQMERFDVFGALREAILLFNERARREAITLTYEIASESAVMYGDRNRIKQVFVNVLDNAFKYSEQGGSILVQAVLDQNTVRISIQDCGCGISQADLPHVTEKFYKANTAVRGSGIGLAVVAEIVTMHGGKLHIDSTPGEGTTVTLRFPIETQAALPKGE